MNSPLIHADARQKRADDLADAGFNGLRLVLVSVPAPGGPDEATLEVFFFNPNAVAALQAAAITPAQARALFPVTGGQRRRAGSAIGQVQVTSVQLGATTDSLRLTVAPIGDYSTYTLGVVHSQIDPLFAEIPFKFRPGCFTNDCAPAWQPGEPRPASLSIDYLAKDYDSFRHTLITAMGQRVPGWQPTSEADLDQVLIDLFSAAGDELSDFQDRVMAEAYLASARKRVSLARHARLMDYHLHQGNQSSTWLALIAKAGVSPFTLGAGFLVWTGQTEVQPDTVYFATRRDSSIHPLLNRLRLFTWSDAIPALAAGSTQADLLLETAGQAAADEVCNLIRSGNVRQLLLQEQLNPATGNVAGRDPQKRQILRLRPGDAGAATLQDPVTGTWFLRVAWEAADQLRQDYHFVVFLPDRRVEGVSLFHGNLVEVHQGIPIQCRFYEPGQPLTHPNDRHFRRTQRWGVLCPLPETPVPPAPLPPRPLTSAPLAYLPTPVGGEVAPTSTLHIEVEVPGGGSDPWDEVISLVQSDDSEENGDHFAVETDEHQRSVLRFGNGVNGRLLPTGSIVHCRYQVGGGTSGNVGADSLRCFSADAAPLLDRCWNPCDVTNGVDPEPVPQLLRSVPEAFRARQLRAVTLEDYVRRAEEVDGVSRAVASYAWTGSWRTVRLCIDPKGSAEISPDLLRRLAAHVDAVRLIGEDIEIRPPRFVPLKVEVAVCLDPDFWPEDVRFVLEQEFSAGYTPDGRLGFFHPDNWTFGQSIHQSEIAGRIHQIAGVEHILRIHLERFNEPAPGDPALLEARFDEIFQVMNDPDHLEHGSIRFDPKGGRQ